MSWISQGLKALERLFRRRVVNPAKNTLAAELAASLDRIDGAIEQAILRYAESVGGQPLAVFVSVAIANLGLSDRVNQFVADLLKRLSPSPTRAAGLPGREDAARRALVSLRAAIREEAGKA